MDQYAHKLGLVPRNEDGRELKAMHSKHLGEEEPIELEELRTPFLRGAEGIVQLFKVGPGGTGFLFSLAPLAKAD